MAKIQKFPRYMRSDNERFPEENVSSHERVKLIKNVIKYEFNDPALLEKALTHHSLFEDKAQTNDSSYQRLEYIGDAVLSILIASYHYFIHPDLNPGELTKLRAANVDTEKLARVAFKYELYKFLRHNHPTLEGQINEFRNALVGHPVHSMGLIEAPKVLANIVESLVGAIYLDSNSSMDTTWMIVKNLLEPIITPENLKSNPVTMLTEICGKNGLTWEVRDLWKGKHVMEVLVNGEFAGSGNHNNRKAIAFNIAANNAYSLLSIKFNQVKPQTVYNTKANKQKFSSYMRSDDERFPEEKVSSHERVKLVNDIINYKFNDPTLLEEALTHHSLFEDKTHANYSSYQRLEYVGDAVLGLLITKHHYFMYPDLKPGDLTKLRAANVDTEKLARVAFKHELYKFLRHNHPALQGQINEFRKALGSYSVHSWGLIEAPKVLADIVESLIGAIYLDSNSSMDTTWMVVKNLLEPIITPESLKSHPVTMLSEICSKNGLKRETRDLWKNTGNIEFYVNGEFVGRGNYEGKRNIAYNRAAHNAYCHLLSRGYSLDSSKANST